MNGDVSAEFFGAFAHGVHPLSGATAGTDSVAVHSLAVVFDLEQQLTVFRRYVHCASRAVSVTYHVGDCLGHDAERGHLHGGGKPRQAGNVDGGPERSGAGESRNHLIDGTGEAELIECGRAESLDDAPYVEHGRPEVLTKRGDVGRCG